MLRIDKIIGHIAPHMCIVCGRDGSVLCASCLETAGEPPAPRCVGCKQLSPGYKTCNSCRSWIDIYAVYVATEYAGTYEALAHEYKFKLKRQAVESIAAIMAQLPLTIAYEGERLAVVPVPTAPARIRQRGFDHGLLIAKRYGALLSRRAAISLPVEPLLARRSNVRQLGSSRAQRIRQVHNEFYIKHNRNLHGMSIILTDDVTTTGASLAAAARTLKQAGVKRIYAVVYAQKM